MLNDKGLFIAEFPYLIDLIKKVEFDTIYQEHLSYFSITPLEKLLKKHNLYLIDAQRRPIHGGSIRVFVSKKKSTASRYVERLLDQEIKVGILDPQTYLKFGRIVDKIRHELVQLLW